MPTDSRKPAMILGTGCLIAAVVLMAAGGGVHQAVRTRIDDFAKPGLKLTRHIVATTAAWAEEWRLPPESRQETAVLQERIDRLQLRRRQLEIETGQLRRQIAQADRHGVSPVESTAGEPLLVPQLLQATILGEKRDLRKSVGLLLDRGQSDGLATGALILDADGPLIDQGRRTHVAAGDPVYAGQSVVGKIAETGRWTSTVRLVTHPKFRAKARLAHKTGRGITFGAEGVLEGQAAERPRLRLIPPGEPVQVGDAVYTADSQGLLTHPMYYGQVVEAELPAGAAQWTIRVEPAVRFDDLRTVAVLRTTINPTRQVSSTQ